MRVRARKTTQKLAAGRKTGHSVLGLGVDEPLPAVCDNLQC